jgi:hypothetical protein
MQAEIKLHVQTKTSMKTQIEEYETKIKSLLNELE